MSSQRKPVVVVTGAAKGIGLAVTTLLLEKFSATVVAISRSCTDDILKLQKTFDKDLLFIEADVANEKAIRDAIAQTLKTYQHIDGLILNAAIGDPGQIASWPMEEWRKMFDVNFFSLIYTIQAALPALRSSEVGGRIIFVSSGAAEGGFSGMGGYSTSKAAMNSLSRVLASEEPDVVSVSVRPGMVATPMQDRMLVTGKGHLSEEVYAFFEKAHKTGMLIKPEQSGEVIAALALKAPKSLSGKYVSWDGEECKEFRSA